MTPANSAAARTVARGVRLVPAAPLTTSSEPSTARNLPSVPKDGARKPPGDRTRPVWPAARYRAAQACAPRHDATRRESPPGGPVRGQRRRSWLSCLFRLAGRAGVTSQLGLPSLSGGKHRAPFGGNGDAPSRPAPGAVKPRQHSGPAGRPDIPRHARAHGAGTIGTPESHLRRSPRPVLLHLRAGPFQPGGLTSLQGGRSTHPPRVPTGSTPVPAGHAQISLICAATNACQLPRQSMHNGGYLKSSADNAW